MIRPTKTGGAFAALTLLFYLGAQRSETSLLFLVVGLLLSCFILNAVAARWSVRALEIELPSKMTATEGDRLDGQWGIANRSLRGAGLATVQAPWGTALRIGPLAPGQLLHKTPELLLPRRGVYEVRDLVLESSYPFGLVKASRKLGLRGEIVVLPRVYGCLPPRAAGFEPLLGGSFTGAHKSRSGGEFVGVRPIQPGDPPRLIHWRSSAKGQGLQVKEFQRELAGRVSILLDPRTMRTMKDGGEAGALAMALGHSSQARETFFRWKAFGGRVVKTGKEESTLDWAARAVASLAFAALDAGHHLSFIDLSGLTPMSIPPFSHGDELLEALARIGNDGANLTARRLEEAVSLLPKRSSLCFVLWKLDPEVARFFREGRVGRRPVEIYLPAPARVEAISPGLTLHRYGPHSVGGAPPVGQPRL